MLINHNGVDYILIRSNRKTITVEIKKTGAIVRAPSIMSMAEIVTFLEKKDVWIKKHLELVLRENKDLQDLKILKTAEIKELAEKALVIIPEKVKHYASLFGVDYGRITIRNQRTRWGSCSSNGNLSFNCLLVLLPDEIIDSVVAHELCHRKHMNHSPAFYAELTKVYPDYPRCRTWLKENGGLYLSRLP